MTDPFRSGSLFTPNDIHAMSSVLDVVCKTLGVPFTDNRARQVIANYIIDLISRGERDPTTLHDAVLKEVKAS